MSIKLNFESSIPVMIDMLIHIQSEVQAMRDFSVTTYVAVSGAQPPEVMKLYNERYQEGKKTVLAQIRNRYADGFGPEDFLKGIMGDPK